MTLDQYLSDSGISATDFATKAGLTPASVSRIRAGEQNLRRTVMLRIIAASGDRITAEGLVHPNRLMGDAVHDSVNTDPRSQLEGGKNHEISTQQVAA